MSYILYQNYWMEYIDNKINIKNNIYIEMQKYHLIKILIKIKIL